MGEQGPEILRHMVGGRERLQVKERGQNRMEKKKPRTVSGTPSFPGHQLLKEGQKMLKMKAILVLLWEEKG